MQIPILAELSEKSPLFLSAVPWELARVHYDYLTFGASSITLKYQHLLVWITSFRGERSVDIGIADKPGLVSLPCYGLGKKWPNDACWPIMNFVRDDRLKSIDLAQVAIAVLDALPHLVQHKDLRRPSVSSALDSKQEFGQPVESFSLPLHIPIVDDLLLESSRFVASPLWKGVKIYYLPQHRYCFVKFQYENIFVHFVDHKGDLRVEIEGPVHQEMRQCWPLHAILKDPRLNSGKLGPSADAIVDALPQLLKLTEGDPARVEARIVAAYIPGHSWFRSKL